VDLLSLIVLVLVVLWLFGFLGHGLVAAIPAYGDNGLIHLLLVVALIVLVFRLLRGRI